MSRGLRATSEECLLFDPVAGGEALLVLDIGSGEVQALAGNQRQRAESNCGKWEGARLQWVSGGDALLELDVGCAVYALVAFEDETARCGSRVGRTTGKVRVFDPVAGLWPGRDRGEWAIRL